MVQDREVLLDFRGEALEHIDAVEASILEFERCPVERQQEIVASSFCALHSIKGASSCIGLSGVQKLSHSMEELLDRLRSGTLSFRPEMGGALLEGLDVLRRLIEPLPEISDLPLEGVLAHIAASDPLQVKTNDGSGERAECVVAIRNAHSLGCTYELSTVLREALAGRRDVLLDVSQAGFVHTGVLQLICAFIADARSRSVEVRWTARDPAFDECARLLGLDTLLFAAETAAPPPPPCAGVSERDDL